MSPICNTKDFWRNSYPKWQGDVHKHQRGHSAILCGDELSTGAACLSAQAMLRIGAGLATIFGDKDALKVCASCVRAFLLCPLTKPSRLPALMVEKNINSIVLGPNAGVNWRTKQCVVNILTTTFSSIKHIILDADALTVFSRDSYELFKIIKNYNEKNQGSCVVMTPHAGEFRRLFSMMKNNNKKEAAKEAANLSGAMVVFKGAETIIASPFSSDPIITHQKERPELATAGSGDVLTGMIAGLLAQKMPTLEAIASAVWIHNACGKSKKHGLIADDMPEIISSVVAAALL